MNPTHSPASSGFRNRAAGLVMNLCVLASIGGLAWWGHGTEWQFGYGKNPANEASNAGQSNPALRVMIVPSVPLKDVPGLKQTVRIEFDTEAAVEKAGIEIAIAWKAPMIDSVEASGEIGFDPTRTARLSSRVSGTVERIFKKFGDEVKAGEILALIDAGDVGKAKSDYLQSLVQLRLKRKSLLNLRNGSGVVSERQLREAEAAERESEVRLLGAEQTLANLGIPARTAAYAELPLDGVMGRIRFLGMTEAEVAKLGQSPTSANLFPIRSPRDGIVLSSDIVAGEVVDSSRTSFVVVDPSVVWLTLHVAEEDAVKIALDQKVRFQMDGSPKLFEGVVSWIGSSANESTRTIPVRVELGNEHGQLRASTLGKGRIIQRDIASTIVLPNEAVHSFKGVPVVFLRDRDYLKPGGSKAFQAMPVRTGAKDKQNTEIRAGLENGSVVAGKNSQLLLDEMKSGFASQGSVPAKR